MISLMREPRHVTRPAAFLRLEGRRGSERGTSFGFGNRRMAHLAACTISCRHQGRGTTLKNRRSLVDVFQPALGPEARIAEKRADMHRRAVIYTRSPLVQIKESFMRGAARSY